MKVQKIGNSYMISIPKSVVRKLNIKKGDKLDFTLKDASRLTYLTPTKTNFNDFIGGISIPGFDLMEAIKSYKIDQYEDKIKRSYGKNLSR